MTDPLSSLSYSSTHPSLPTLTNTEKATLTSLMRAVPSVVCGATAMALAYAGGCAIGEAVTQPWLHDSLSMTTLLKGTTLSAYSVAMMGIATSAYHEQDIRELQSLQRPSANAHREFRESPETLQPWKKVSMPALVAYAGVTTLVASVHWIMQHIGVDAATQRAIAPAAAALVAFVGSAGVLVSGDTLGKVHAEKRLQTQETQISANEAVGVGRRRKGPG